MVDSDFANDKDAKSPLVLHQGCTQAGILLLHYEL
jgi:hypothetical protein